MIPDSLMGLTDQPAIVNFQWWHLFALLVIVMIVWRLMVWRKNQLASENSQPSAGTFREIDGQEDEEIVSSEYVVDVSGKGIKCPGCGKDPGLLKIKPIQGDECDLDLVVTACCNTLISAANLEY